MEGSEDRETKPSMKSTTGGMSPNGVAPEKSSKTNSSPTHVIQHPSDPHNWPLWKKLHATIASWFAVFSLLYATTVAAPVVPLLPEALHTTVHLANFAFSAPFFGVFFAPLYTPHLSELFGRKPVYIVSISLFLVFIGGISLVTSITQLVILRIFAGLVGGPMAVLIEGTHADVWPARRTVTYYCSIALSQYWGAAFGYIIGYQVLAYGGVPWTAYSALIFTGFSWLLVATMPETYHRQILRSLAKSDPTVPPIPPALSGVTLAEMARITVVTPLLMISEPLVLMGGLLLGLTFAVVFQWFITVPFVLANVYQQNAYTISLVFFAAVSGAALSFVSSMLIESLSVRVRPKGSIEMRLLSGMLGVVLTFLSLFWVGWTAKADMPYIVPVTGTAFYVWGNMSILLSIISYFFDAFHPAGILSALTAMACFRLLCAGLIPIFILDMFSTITPPWSLSLFGFLNLAMLPIPFVMFGLGHRLRMNSRFMRTQGGMSPVEMEKMEETESQDVSV